MSVDIYALAVQHPARFVVRSFAFCGLPCFAWI